MVRLNGEKVKRGEYNLLTFSPFNLLTYLLRTHKSDCHFKGVVGLFEVENKLLL